MKLQKVFFGESNSAYYYFLRLAAEAGPLPGVERVGLFVPVLGVSLAVDEGVVTLIFLDDVSSFASVDSFISLSTSIKSFLGNENSVSASPRAFTLVSRAFAAERS